MMATIQEHVKVIHPDRATVDFSSLWKCLGSFDANPMGIDWFGMVFGLGLAVSFGYWCTDFLQVQRVIVAKNLRAAQNGTLIGAMLKMCVPLIVTIPGLLGLAVLLNPDGSPLVLVAESDPRANITHQTFNEVLPLLMGKYLGPGLLGLGVTAMIAGFMSGMAGNVSAFATVWTYDVYKPLLNRTASDRHYLNVGRWASLLGVLISIGTAYLCFYFTNILDFLQVLVFFFIVPLFGVVILGMLWKRCTPAGGFWGFLIAILFSMSMWVFVHTFPDGYRPPPQIILGKRGRGARTIRTAPDKPTSDRVIVQSGTVQMTNVFNSPRYGTPFFTRTGNWVVEFPQDIPWDTGRYQDDEHRCRLRLLAPDVVLAETKQKSKFGIEGIPVVLMPGVKVESIKITQHFNPAVFNKSHQMYIARSEKAQPMAVNMYSAFWTLLVSLFVAVGVSLFTTPKSDAELKNLVMGLTPRPDEGPCPWYERPALWAAVVLVILVAVNILFW